MFTNSLFSDYLKENGLKVWKDESTRDIICLEFNYGSRSYPKELEHLYKTAYKAKQEYRKAKVKGDTYLLNKAKNKKDNVVVWETIDSIIIQIRYLKNYFKNLERKINTPEYFDVKKQGLYFLKPILRMLEILDIILEDNKKYYNNVDLVNYSNVKDLTDFLNKMREEILNEKNDEEIIRGREILKKIIYKVEPEFNKYSDLDKEKISELLYWLYEELSSRIGISQEEKFEWNTMGIKLFRLKKYKKYWEPRGIRYRI